MTSSAFSKVVGFRLVKGSIAAFFSLEFCEILKNIKILEWLDKESSSKMINTAGFLTSLSITNKFKTYFHVIDCPLRLVFSFKNLAITFSNDLSKVFVYFVAFYFGRAPKSSGY